MDLKGKTAVVTGGAVRLGRAISLALADAGANVVVHYGSSTKDAKSTCREIEARGVRALGVSADLREPLKAAETLFAAVSKEFGTADILINSAAIFEPGSLDSTTEDEWDRHLAINLKSPFFLCQAFARQVGEHRNGQIVNIADWRAIRPIVGHAAYTLSKAGIVALTKALALELAPRIRVNAIAPGAILPPPDEDAAYLERMAERIPLRHSGSPDDITAALLYLLTNDFLTGEVLHVTGGEHL